MSDVIELKGKKGPKPKREFKTTLTDEELYELLCQYSRWYYLKFKHVWHLKVDQEDIFGELAVKAMEAKAKYDPSKKTSLRTFLITAFARRMENYRKYLYVRQVKWPMERITMC